MGGFLQRECSVVKSEAIRGDLLKAFFQQLDCLFPSESTDLSPMSCQCMQISVSQILSFC